MDKLSGTLAIAQQDCQSIHNKIYKSIYHIHLQTVLKAVEVVEAVAAATAVAAEFTCMLTIYVAGVPANGERVLDKFFP